MQHNATKIYLTSKKWASVAKKNSKASYFFCVLMQRETGALLGISQYPRTTKRIDFHEDKNGHTRPARSLTSARGSIAPQSVDWDSDSDCDIAPTVLKWDSNRQRLAWTYHRNLHYNCMTKTSETSSPARSHQVWTETGLRRSTAVEEKKSCRERNL